MAEYSLLCLNARKRPASALHTVRHDAHNMGRRLFSKRISSLPSSAASGEDHPPLVWRRGRSLDDQPRIFSSYLPARECVRPLADWASKFSLVLPGSRSASALSLLCFDSAKPRLEAVRTDESRTFADIRRCLPRPLGCLLCCLSATSPLLQATVRAIRPQQQWTVPILRPIQRRIASGPVELSGACRTLFNYSPPGAGMVLFLRAICCCLCMARLSKPWHFDGFAVFWRAAIAKLEDASAMGCTSRGRFRSAIGRHKPHFPGCCRGAPALGCAVIAVST